MGDTSGCRIWHTWALFLVGMRTNLKNVVEATTRCRDVEHAPDGSLLSATAKHALLVLASYYPTIRPPQARIAANMGVSRRTVNRALAELEAAGLIERKSGAQHYATHYVLKLAVIRKCLGASKTEPTKPVEADPEGSSFDW